MGNRGISIRQVANILRIPFGLVERLLKRQTICNVELVDWFLHLPTPHQI